MPLAQVELNYTQGVPSGFQLVYLHSDHLNTPRLASTHQGIVWSWISDAYGAALPNEDVAGSGTATHIPLRFPGQIYDAQTQLSYNYYRDYDANLGRYVQSDPIGLGGGMNTYAYVEGNPMSWVDPGGLSSITYDGQTHTITVTDSAGNTVGTFSANNKTTTTSSGPWPNGTVPYTYSNPHPESDANGPYGSHGIFVFNVPGRSGMGLHSGRANNGAQNHPTFGCIRTTDAAMSFIRDFVPGDPLTTMTVINNNPNAPQVGTQQ